MGRHSNQCAFAPSLPSEIVVKSDRRAKLWITGSVFDFFFHIEIYFAFFRWLIRAKVPAEGKVTHRLSAL